MSTVLPILLVEDDADLREALEMTLTGAGFVTDAVASGPEALQQLGKRAYGLVISDYKMAPMDGLALLARIRERLPALPVVMMTAYGDVPTAVQAMRLGACEFLLKPFAAETLLEVVRRYAHTDAGLERVPLIAHDPASQAVLQLAQRVAATDATVLLCGESGVGKEVFARWIHAHSPRRDGPFVAINCAAIPEALLEATLFGHEKGAFTGASTAQPGKFEQAQGGTILLDEISEMPLALQAKLLRVLQEKEVERLGSKKAIPLDVRVIATTNRRLEEEVTEGRFRQDLYYRLAVFPLAIPPLRERRADIVPLARFFLQRHASRLGKPGAALSADAEAVLTAYAWPGNVRELENTLQRALILSPGLTIDALTLRQCLPVAQPEEQRNPFDIAASLAAELAAEAVPSHDAASGGNERAFFAADGTAAKQTKTGGLRGGSSSNGSRSEKTAAELTKTGGLREGALSLGDRPARDSSLRDWEREQILRVLAEENGSRKRTAQRLGIPERTLRYRLKRYREQGFEIPGETP